MIALPAAVLKLGALVRPAIVVAALALVAHLALKQAEQRGWDRREERARLDNATLDRRIAEERLQNLIDASERSARLRAELDEQQAALDARALTLEAHLARQARTAPKKVPTHESQDPAQPAPAPTPEPDRPLLGAAVLDGFTVCVLNAARANHPDRAHCDAAGRGDAKGQAPAAAAPEPVTGGEFAANDLEVVKLYHELAARHDELVDWVNAQCLAPPKTNPTPQ